MCEHPKNFCFVAEGVGFEPTIPLGITVFKTAAFNHSAIPPIIYEIENTASYKANSGSAFPIFPYFLLRIFYLARL